MTPTTNHLSPDQVDEALAYRLGDGPAEHLRSCHACQVAVEWNRLAKLCQLDDLDTDWYSRTTMALALHMRSTGKGLVYAVTGIRQRARLALLRFELPPTLKIEVGSHHATLSASLTQAPVLSHRSEEEITQRILRRWERREIGYPEAAQQLIALGYEPDELLKGR